MNTKYNNKYNLLGTNWEQLNLFSIKKENFKIFKILFNQLVAGAGFEPTTFGL